jgi:GTPase SAR1 family protein
MLPVFIGIGWIVTAVLGGFGVGLAGSALYQAVMKKWKGKRVAVLGARAVGKSTFMTFLTTGSIPEDYEETLHSSKCDGRRFKLKDLQLRIKDSFDVGGAKHNYAEWKKEFIASDIVFYLLRADLLMSDDSDTVNRVRNDFEIIKDWIAELKEKDRPTFYIIGTHCDLDSLYSKLPEKNKAAYIDKFQILPIIVDLRCLGGVDKVILGSMKTLEYTQALVYAIFKQVTL